MKNGGHAQFADCIHCVLNSALSQTEFLNLSVVVVNVNTTCYLARRSRWRL